MAEYRNFNVISWLIPEMKGSILLAGEDLFAFSDAFPKDAQPDTGMLWPGLTELADQAGSDAVPGCEDGAENGGSSGERRGARYDWIVAGRDALAGAGSSAKTGAGAGSVPGTASEERLQVLQRLLKEDGTLVLLAENRLGMSRFAGMADEETGKFFDGIEGYPEGGTSGTCVSRPVLERRLRQAGFADLQFYYPYPDSFAAEAVYSDAWLPHGGAFARRRPVPEQGRLQVFREEAALDAAAEDGLFALFADSFLVFARKEASEVDGLGTAASRPVYVKYSCERDPRFQIRTEIRMGADGIRSVIKAPCTACAKGWIRGLKEKEQRLTVQLTGTGFGVNACTMQKDAACFSWAEGSSFESELDALLERGEREKFFTSMREMLARMDSGKPFAAEEGFTERFGVFPVPEGWTQAICSDADLIFANLMMDEDSCTVIDYEWTFPFPLPAGFVQYRSLHYYLNGSSMRRRLLTEEELLALLPAGEEELQRYRLMEERFQDYIHGEDKAKRSGREEGPVADLTGTAAKSLRETSLWESEVRFLKEKASDGAVKKGAEGKENAENRKALRSSAGSRIFHAYSEGRITFRIRVPKGTERIRIQPCRRRCVLRLEKLEGRLPDGTPVPAGKLQTETNGRVDGNGDYVFDTETPFLQIHAAGMTELLFAARAEALEGLLRDAVLAQSPLVRKVTQSGIWKMIHSGGDSKKRG